MLAHILLFKGGPKKIKNKFVENNLFLLANNVSGFDGYVVLNNLPQWRSVVNLIKNGAGIISLKIFNGFVDEKKKVPQNVHFRCGRAHTNKCLRKTGESDKLQLSMLKQELEHDEFMRIHGKLKKTSGCLMLRTMFHQLLSVMLDIQRVWKN